MRLRSPVRRNRRLAPACQRAGADVAAVLHAVEVDHAREVVRLALRPEHRVTELRLHTAHGHPTSRCHDRAASCPRETACRGAVRPRRDRGSRRPCARSRDSRRAASTTPTAARGSQSTDSRREATFERRVDSTVRSERMRLRIGCVSGSPSRQLNSSTLGVPSLAIMSPAYRNPTYGCLRRRARAPSAT